MEPNDVFVAEDPPISRPVVMQKRTFAAAFPSLPDDNMTGSVFGQSPWPFQFLKPDGASNSFDEAKRSRIELLTPSTTSIEESCGEEVDALLTSVQGALIPLDYSSFKIKSTFQKSSDGDDQPASPPPDVKANPSAAQIPVTKLPASLISQKTKLFEQFGKYVESNTGVVKNGRAEFARKEQALNYTNTPVFSSAVSIHVESNLPEDWPATELIPQFGLIGLREHCEDENLGHAEQNKMPDSDLVFGNVNAPWSAFICGSRGAGKSHTLSCLLENTLLKDNDAGQLANPLAGMVFHYDTYTNASSTQLCEAAYLCSSGIPVTILVSPSNIWTMKRLYSNLPGLPANSPKPKILPLYLAESSLDIEKILKLMVIDPTSDRTPLYMEIVMKTLREMAMEGAASKGFRYSDFRRRLSSIDFNPGQSVPLTLRLQLLESFLEPSATTLSTRPAPADDDIWAFEAGTLTIIDLSDPFVNGNDACSLFAICLSNFLEGRNKCGRVIALDEAHKFLTHSGEALALTADLTSVIRQQRHTGTRVMIATQEPTLSPDLIDLCNATFVHRFLSPAWYETLKAHLAGANKYEKIYQDSLFDKIVTLKTGEALLFCPTALLDIDDSVKGKTTRAMANGYAKIKIRKRLTADGGKSIMASDVTGHAIVTASANDVPMYVVIAPRPQPKVRKAAKQQPLQPVAKSAAIVQDPQRARDQQLQNQQIQDRETQNRLLQITREEISPLFIAGKHYFNNIKFSKLWPVVERRVAVRAGTIRRTPQYLSACRLAVFEELNRLRVQKGLKPQEIAVMNG